MSLPPLTVALALKTIRNTQIAGYLRNSVHKTLVEPREVYFASAAIWVRVDGRRISGALRGHLHPKFWDRWRIRRAFRQRTKPIGGVLS